MNKKICNAGLDFVHQELIGSLDGCGLLWLWSHVSDMMSHPCASKHIIREEKRWHCN